MSSRNRVYGVGLLLVVGGFASVPFVLARSRAAAGVESLTQQRAPLVGHQLMRGAYNNHGSRDAGADPDWGVEGGGLIWKGRSASGTGKGFAPTEEQLAPHRAKLDAALRARGLLAPAADVPAR